MKSMNNEPPPAIPVSVPLLDGRKNVNAKIYKRLADILKSSLTEKMNRFLDLTDLKTGRLNFFIRKR